MGVIGPRQSLAELASDQIGRNESADRFMGALARMVFDTIIPTEDAGNISGTLPDSSDHLVRCLLEHATGNGLGIKSQPHGRTIAHGKRPSWLTDAASPGIAAILPGRQTDTELHHTAAGRRIVIDTEFTEIFTAST